MEPRLFHRLVRVRGSARRSRVLSFAKTCSIRIQVGRIGGQEQQAGAFGLDRLTHPCDFVAAEIVGHHDVTRIECGSEELLDPGAEAAAIDCTIEDGGGDDPIMSQPGQEGAGIPMPERRRTEQPLAPATATPQRRHVGLGPSLVEEDQALGVQSALSSAPEMAGRGNVHTRLLTGPQRLFLSVRPRSCSVFHIVPRLTATPCLRSSQARNSASVADDRRATWRRIAFSNPATRRGRR